MNRLKLNIVEHNDLLKCLEFLRTTNALKHNTLKDFYNSNEYPFHKNLKERVKESRSLTFSELAYIYSGINTYINSEKNDPRYPSKEERILIFELIKNKIINAKDIRFGR